MAKGIRVCNCDEITVNATAGECLNVIARKKCLKHMAGMNESKYYEFLNIE